MSHVKSKYIWLILGKTDPVRLYYIGTVRGKCMCLTFPSALEGHGVLRSASPKARFSSKARFACQSALLTYCQQCVGYFSFGGKQKETNGSGPSKQMPNGILACEWFRLQSASCSLLMLEIQMLFSDKKKNNNNPARPWSYRPQIKWALELA